MKLFRDISKTEQDDVEYQRALTAIGWCHLEFGRFIERKWDEEGKSDDKKKEQITEMFLKADKFSRHAFAAIPDGTDMEKCPLKERKEMKVVVLINRGLVAMALKNFENAHSYFLEACHITKDSTYLYDRYYVSIFNHQTNNYIKEMNYSEALKSNKHIMATLEKLPTSDSEKHQLHYDALNQKIQILIGLRQFQQAKNICKSLFVRNGASKDDMIGKSLKNINSICRLLNTINASSDVQSLTKNYERIGDLCVSLERYDTANYYYEKAAELANVDDSKLLCALYFSIAENCMDLESFEKAHTFYTKKLELCRLDAKESCQTSLRLAKCAHLNGKSLHDILTLCKEARKLAVRSGRIALEARVLQVTHSYQRKHGSSSGDGTKQELERLVTQYNLNENELEMEENDQEELMSEASEEFDLDAISDGEEEDSDNELKCFSVSQVKSGRKRGSFKYNTNAKGETDLHVKCQEEGNLEAIKTLIKMGHELNIADRAKFTAIHEACNYGFLEYVKELHVSGAKLNLKSNSGVTPLITACSNGSIEIIEYLIDAGALVHLQEECGWTAKDHLLNYLKNNRPSVSNEMQDRFRTILKRMDLGMKGYELLPKKHISTVFETEGEQSCILPDENEAYSTNENIKENKLSRSNRKHATNRNKTDIRRALEPVQLPKVLNEGNNSVKNYVDAVSCVKKRRLVQPRLNLLPLRTSTDCLTQPALHPNPSKLINEDNWLIDDIPKIGKKSKTNKTLNFRSQEYRDTKRQRIDGINSAINIEKNRKKEQIVTNNYHSPPKDISFDENFPITSTQLSATSPNNPQLLEEELQRSNSIETKHQPEVQVLSRANIAPCNILRFSVQIEERRLLIPLPKEKYISDLCKAVMQRFNNTIEVNKATGRMPIITLLDNEGCELDNGDKLIDLFGETVEPIRLLSRIEKWQLENIETVYEKLCQDMNMIHLPEAKHALTESQHLATLNLNKSIIRPESSQPIFRSLRFRSHITEINLSGNKLGIDCRDVLNQTESSFKCMEELGSSIQTLSTLQKLDISSNALNYKHLDVLTRSMFRVAGIGTENDDCKINLREIDVGFNDLGDECDNSIISILGNCQYLESLKISNCDLSKHFFLKSYKKWESVFEKKTHCPMKKIDISHNPKIGVVGIDKMLQLFDVNSLISMNIKSCTDNLSGNIKENLGEVIFRFSSRGRPDIALQELDMSQNYNVEIEDICNAFYHMSHLKKLCLSYCDGLTYDIIVKFFEELWTQSSNCQHLKIHSNTDIWSYLKEDPDSFQRLLTNMKYLTSENSLTQLELSFQKESSIEREAIRDIILCWYNVFNDRSKIEMNSRNVIMSVLS